jgi:hypothetical protein
MTSKTVNELLSLPHLHGFKRSLSLSNHSMPLQSNSSLKFKQSPTPPPPNRRPSRNWSCYGPSTNAVTSLQSWRRRLLLRCPHIRQGKRRIPHGRVQGRCYLRLRRGRSRLYVCLALTMAMRKFRPLAADSLIERFPHLDLHHFPFHRTIMSLASLVDHVQTPFTALWHLKAPSRVKF